MVRKNYHPFLILFFLDFNRDVFSYDFNSWRKLLLIPGLSSNKSIVDDPKFFISPQGKKNPQLELDESIKKLFNSDPNQVSNQDHLQCKFPARYHWLKKNIKDFGDNSIDVDCKELKNFMSTLSYEKISLVFSNYFINHPSSMAGHTFLRIHRYKNNSSYVDDAGLLDHVLNFSAVVGEDVNPVIYPIAGLMGGYQGYFSLQPYYQKIQEYSNYESRDLWEYELKTTPEQIYFFKLLMWEISHIYIDYYFFDDNCSFILLVLLENLYPEKDLTSQFLLYATPPDTLRALTTHQELITNVTYRPSILTRYLNRINILSVKEYEAFFKISQTDVSDLKNFDASAQVRILDASLDYIDYKNHLPGSNQNSDDALRNKLLSLRAKIPIATQLDTQQMKKHSSPPDIGHDSHRVGMWGGVKKDKDLFLDINWRPALHDIKSNAAGYSNSMEISFFDTWLRWDKSKISRFNFHPFSITSLPESYPLFPKYAWQLDLQYENEKKNCYIERKSCEAIYGSYSFGKAIHFIPGKFYSYGLLGVDLGNQLDLAREFFMGGNIHLGVLGDYKNFKLSLSSKGSQKYFKKDKFSILTYELSFISYANKNLEIRCELISRNYTSEVKVGLVYY